MPKTMLIALHGMMGNPSDFDCFSAADFGVDHLVPLPLIGVEKRVAEIKGKKILLGYSMGGRVALQLLLKHPHLFSAAVLVSTHPGLKSEEERKERHLLDQTWIKKMQTMPKEIWLKEWEEQDVFKIATIRFPREDLDISYQVELLKRYSLGLQDDLEDEIAACSVPLLWITGELDSKFSKLVKGRHYVIEGAGHRALWDKPEEFKRIVREFISSSIA